MECVMAVLTAAVVVLGLIGLLNLVLTIGVIRRLREHTAMLANGAGMGMHGPPPASELVPGQRPAEFSVRIDGGDELSGPAGLRVVAFFSPLCSVCPERVPPFVEYVSSHAIDRDCVLAVVEHNEGVAAPTYLDTLATVAQVCSGPDGDSVTAAFKIQGNPAFAVLNADGVLVATGYEPLRLPEPVGV
jgi:hypothetical protein